MIHPLSACGTKTTNANFVNKAAMLNHAHKKTVGMVFYTKNPTHCANPVIA